MQLNIAGDTSYALIVGMCLYFSTEVLQSRHCTGTAGYKTDNPAGFVSFKTLNKLFVEAAADFPAGVGGDSAVSGIAEPSLAPLSHPPWLTACHTPSLAKASQPL